MSNTSQIGASLSDLVAHVHALVTENESDKHGMLAQRLLDIRSSTDAIVRYAEGIATERREEK